MKIEFFVPGIPRPGGSKRAFFNRRTGKAMVVEDCKTNRDWRATVQLAARDAYSGPPLSGPIALYVVFHLPRPKSHYGTGRNADRLKPSAPRWHATKPDTTKLLRSTEDALTGVIWRDDALIARQTAVKQYAETCGAMIVAATLED